MLRDSHGNASPEHDNRYKFDTLKSRVKIVQKNVKWTAVLFWIANQEFLKEIDFEDYDIAVLKHRVRNNALEEAEQILKRDWLRNSVQNWTPTDYYRKAGYKFDNGLAETGI